MPTGSYSATCPGAEAGLAPAGTLHQVHPSPIGPAHAGWGPPVGTDLLSRHACEDFQCNGYPYYGDRGPHLTPGGHFCVVYVAETTRRTVANPWDSLPMQPY